MVGDRFSRRQAAWNKGIGALCALLAGFFPFGAPASAEATTTVANFEAQRSTATEGNGRIALKVTFSQAFNGNLTYSVGGTAERVNRGRAIGASVAGSKARSNEWRS